MILFSKCKNAAQVPAIQRHSYSDTTVLYSLSERYSILKEQSLNDIFNYCSKQCCSDYLLFLITINIKKSLK